MKKTSKIFLYVSVAVIVLLCGVFFLRDLIIRDAANKYGPEAVRTRFSIGRVETSFSPMTVRIWGLDIGNPQGFSPADLFKLGSVTVAIQEASLLRDTIVIDRIAVSGVTVLYELAGTKSNISTLVDNLNANAAAAHPAPAPKSSRARRTRHGHQGKHKNVVIKELSITDAQVKFAAALQGQNASGTLKLPDLKLHNIGGARQHMTLEQGVSEIIRLFSAHTLKAISESAFKDVLDVSDQAIGQAKDAGKAIKGILNQ